MSSETPVDFERLFSEIGDTKIGMTFIHRYLELVDAQITRIDQAISAGDAVLIHREAHSIKGGALNIHAPGLQSAAAELEKDAKVRELGRSTVLLEAIKKEFENVRSYVMKRDRDGEKMKKVLYAEDEFTNRKLVEIQLKNNGFDCDLVSDGRAALEMFENHSYGIVILDQYMPGMNGDQVARAIRKRNSTIPLFAITSDDGEILALRNAGFSEIFIKPLKGKNFIEAVKKYLDQEV
jgi:CheY-like chemotaxis protein